MLANENPGTCGAAAILEMKPGTQKLTPPSSATAGLAEMKDEQSATPPLIEALKQGLRENGLIGAMNGSPHRKEADAFLAFLQSSEGQDAYAKFGFVKASEADLKLRTIN